jgi:hypothetical protein
MDHPRFQFRPWLIFALTALVAYLCLWYTVFREERKFRELWPKEDQNPSGWVPGDRPASSPPPGVTMPRSQPDGPADQEKSQD